MANKDKNIPPVPLVPSDEITVVTISVVELKKLIETAADLAAAKVVEHDRPSADRVSAAKAYREFGRARVDDWFEQSLIKREYVGDRFFYSMSELKAAAQACRSNRAMALQEYYQHESIKRARREGNMRKYNFGEGRR